MTLCPSPRSISASSRAAVGVELAHDVVEQHERHRVARRRERLALGEQQRQQRQPLLALRAVRAQLAPVAQQRDVVAVRAVAGEAALEVGVDALGELGGELVGVGGARARPVAQLGPVAEPERGGDRGEARREQLDDRRAVVAQRDPVARRARRPRPAASSREARPLRIRASSALRCASAWP